MMQENEIKLLVLSDLHLGFDSKSKMYDLDIREDIDLIILAGDIVDGADSDATQRNHLLHLTKGIKTIYIPGNHEFYSSSRKMVCQEFKKFFRQTNIQFLLNAAVIINGYRFIVSDLWTDFGLTATPSESMYAAKRSMSDFKLISVENPDGTLRALKPIDTVLWHNECRSFIERELINSTEPTILVTHHGISPKCNNSNIQRGPLDAAFSNNFESFLESLAQPPVLAIYGHTHEYKFETLNCGTVLHSNPRGYGRFEKVHGYDPSRVIRIRGNCVEAI